MKTYVCDMCGDYETPCKRVPIREINCGGKIFKKKIHLCQRCWAEIVGISRKKKDFKIPDNYTEFIGNRGDNNAE